MSDKQPPDSTPNPEGKYANRLEVGHNAFEFILDFGQLYDGNNSFVISARIVTTPYYAEAFYETLGSALENYRRRFGAIEQGEPPSSH